jgi:hypothetical protein
MPTKRQSLPKWKGIRGGSDLPSSFHSLPEGATADSADNADFLSDVIQAFIRAIREIRGSFCRI